MDILLQVSTCNCTAIQGPVNAERYFRIAIIRIIVFKAVIQTRHVRLNSTAQHNNSSCHAHTLLKHICPIIASCLGLSGGNQTTLVKFTGSQFLLLSYCWKPQDTGAGSALAIGTGAPRMQL